MRWSKYSIASSTIDSSPTIRIKSDPKKCMDVSIRPYPTWDMKTWITIAVVIAFVVQSVALIQVRRRIDEQEERITKMEHALTTTGSIKVSHAQSSGTQLGGYGLGFRERVNRTKRNSQVDETGNEPSSQERQQRMRGRGNQQGYVTRNQLARALDGLNTIIEEDMHTSFHVVPLLDDSVDEDVAVPGRVAPLRWSRRSPLSHMTGFQLNPETGQNVEVTVPGTYFVYSQVTYNGRNSHRGGSQAPCSHITMLKPFGRDASGHPKAYVTLLYSVTTQCNTGRHIHAYDSVYQAGVFQLEAGDRLSVRPDIHSVHCRFVVHPEKTFFGTFRLNPNLGSPYSRRD